MKEKIALFIFLVVFAYITTPIIKSNSISNNKLSNITSYKVEKGETLWTIALKNDVKNVEEFIFNTKKINNIQNSQIFVDQTLIIP